MHRDRLGTERSYVRFVALGDSATFGLGDCPGDSYRGWASLLVSAIGQEHDVSFCNLAFPGARAADVRFFQIPTALEHGPHVASLIVGINDTLHADWDGEQVRIDLLQTAAMMHERGALLLTARFHDHSRVFRLPGFLARPLRARIEQLNAVYDEIHQLYGGVQVDLASHPGVYDREFWSADRLHPSELGHRVLADEFAAGLAEHGLCFDSPGLQLDGPTATAKATARTVMTEVVPWIARKLAEFAPVLIRGAQPAGA
jgi:lysophospholipase L1-like esterase